MSRTALQPGTIIAGKYQVVELLGRGGMGHVYLARHTVTGKRVALKMLAGGLASNAQADKRLVREAVAAGCIEHRHVVNVFDIGEHEGAHFLVMEYLEGKSFKQLINERKSSDRELLEILLRAMDGVRAAHAQGVIHRDLKPDNILVCQGPSGHYDDPKVVDFGICRISAQSGVTDLTQVGVTMGSPFYMSLEQLQGLRDLDGRADLYSLAVIVYQALTQRRPYEATTLGELTSKIANGTPPMSLAQLRPDLPRRLSQVVMRGLSRARNERQPDVATLMRELAPFVSQLSDTQPAMSARPLLVSATQAAHTPMPTWNHERARPWLQLGAAAVAAFALTLGGISLVRSLQRARELAAQPVELAPQPPAASVAPLSAVPAAAAAPLAPTPLAAPESVVVEAARLDEAAPSVAPHKRVPQRRVQSLRPPRKAAPPASPKEPVRSKTPPPIDTSDPYR